MSRSSIDAGAEPGRRIPLAGLLPVLLAAALGGCSIQKIATDAMADAMASSSAVYSADEDVELVGAAIPFGLKTMESVLTETPGNRGLLLAAARGFTQYAFVYVQLRADRIEEHDVEAAYALRERARSLYLRARGYGMRGLETTHPDFASRLHSDPDAVLAETTRDDVALLYWTAAAWAAAITLGKDDPALLAGLPRMEAMVMRAFALDESFDAGAIHVFLIGLEMGRPGAGEAAAIAARQHLERAVALSHGAQAAPYVTYAESVSVPRQDREEFVHMLGRALDVDPANAQPEWRLANAVMKSRARWLRARTDEYFSN